MLKKSLRLLVLTLALVFGAQAAIIPPAPTNLVLAASVPEYLKGTLPGDATKYLDGTGVFTVPGGSSRVDPSAAYLKSIATNGLTGGFGVVGDGSTNDTAAINSAISAAVASSTNLWNGYHVLYFPGGASGATRTYSVNDVFGQSNLYIIGDKDQSVIQQVNGGYVATFNGNTHVRISDIAFDANGTDNTFGGVRFYEAIDVVIERTHFYDSASLGFTASNDRYSYVFAVGGGGITSKDIILRDNLIEDLQVEIDHCERVLVERNTILRGPTTAALGFFSIAGSSGNKVHDVTVRHNRIVDPKWIGIDFVVDHSTSFDSFWRRIHVYDNEIVMRRRAVVAIQFGAASSIWDLTAGPAVFEDINVSDNRIYYEPTAEDVTGIDGILFRSSTLNGFYFQRTKIANNKVIAHRRIAVGIQTRRLRNSLVKGNVVLKAYDAFAMDDIDTTVLTDNYAEARNTGYLYTNGGAGNTTTGNFYLGAPTTTADAGFSAPSWAQADAVYAVELFGTKTWDPGSVTSGGVPVTTTVTVPNVGAHMFIRVSFDLPLQGMQLTASYSAANTVTVVLSNLTGGAIDLGSGNLYVVASYLN